MKPVDVTVIVPAWGDRPSAAGAINAYRDALDRAQVNYELLVLEEPQVWGAAIVLGLNRAQGEYVLAGVDDCPAVDDGWWPAARRLASEGDVVGCVVLEPRETGPPEPVRYCTPKDLYESGGEVPFAMTPLARRDVWAEIGPVPPTHAYTDIYVADKARSQGRRVMVCPEWRAVHLNQSVAAVEDGQVYDAWKEVYL